MILGLDIGGANTKAASSDGWFVSSTYLPLWKGCDLEGTLDNIRQGAGPVKAVGVTITGELADCYPTKKDGIEHISSVVKRVFPEATFFGSDGRFYEDTSDHTLFSAANWSASARFVGRMHKNVLFIDIGSTTTDIIPIMESQPKACMTDFERLSNGELIYAGTLRTNIAALLRKAEVKGKSVRTSSELFAITGDAHVLLDYIDDADYTCDTPDGAGKDKNAAALRLARVVCCDLEELSMDDARDIAGQAHRQLLDDLKEGITEVAERHGLKSAVICGIGEFIAKEALCELGMPFTTISVEYGKEISSVFPAYAVAGLLEDSMRR